MSFKKIDFAYWFFFFFSMLIFGALYYTNTINIRTKNNFVIIENLENLKLLNNEIDTLLNKKLQTIDDESVQDILQNINQRIALLHNENLSTIEAYDIATMFERIISVFRTKMSHLESFQTHNNALIEAYDELYLRQANINKRYYFSPISQVANTIVVEFSKSTYNRSSWISNFDKNIKAFENLVEVSQLSDQELTLFLKYAVQAKEHLTHMATISKESQTTLLKPLLDDFRKTLVTFFENTLHKERLIVYFLFFSIFAFISTLVITYRRDKQNRFALLRFRKAVEASDNSIVITDANRLITYVNESFETISGYTSLEVLGKKPNILKSGKTENFTYQDMDEKLKANQRWEGQLVNRKKDGTLYYEKVSIAPIVSENILEGFLAIKLDITDIMESKNKIESLAYYDQLTSLPNRFKFHDMLQESLNQAKDHSISIALLIIDLDNFKEINDTLGHPVGDSLLCSVASKLKNIAKEATYVARIGGDEFGMVIEMPDNENIASVTCKHIIDALKTPIAIDNFSLVTSASIGVSLYPEHASNVFDLMKAADNALYSSKKKEKGKYLFFTNALLEAIQNRLDIKNELLHAIEKNEFFLAFQPQYQLKTKEVIGVEALIRWNSQKFGMVSPTVFIPIAEESGLIIPIGEWVFKEACKRYVSWKEQGITIETIAINLSSIQFQQENFADSLCSIIQDIGIDAHHIELEITERYLFECTQHNMSLLERLHQIGFKLSIDDFGTGYSSMSYLKILPLDTLKIDKSFIDDIPKDASDIAITQAILALAKSLNLHVVAEGIENPEQEAFLTKNGCDIGQGYLFAKPMSQEHFVSFINTQQRDCRK